MPGVSIKFRQAALAEMRRLARDAERAIEDVRGMVPIALREALEPVYELSQEYVPVDVGFLRASGFIDVEMTPQGRFVKGVVGYGPPGSFASTYALIQHENLEFHHERGQAKYLEAAYDELDGESGIRERFADAMQRLIR